MDTKELTKKSRDIMQSLEEKIGETIGLGILLSDSAEGVVLAEVEGTSGVAFHVKVDYHFPLHTSAPGKVLLAYLPKKERDEILSRMDFKQYTPSTLTDLGDFNAELKAVVEKGYSIDVSEQLEGCHCVGVPVFDETKTVVASLWTTGPSSQLPVRRFSEISEIMKKGAQELSSRLCVTGRAPSKAYVLSVVAQAKEIIDNGVHQTIDMKELAANLYVSYSWFRKVFKEKTGEAPAEYHLNRRIEKACELLRTTDRSIRHISEELGFKNQNHFSALFKRKTGRSPLSYRAASHEPAGS
jgi:DNA-binding IclR family transcriptional regulator